MGRSMLTMGNRTLAVDRLSLSLVTSPKRDLAFSLEGKDLLFVQEIARLISVFSMLFLGNYHRLLDLRRDILVLLVLLILLWLRKR
jgi:hypothetical protein